MKHLSVKQLQFIAAMQTGMDGKAAAVAAGYSPRSAKDAAYTLLHDNPMVRAELDKVQQALVAKAEYNGERCMSELDDAIAFAKEHKQANAVVKAVELRARLAGLLRDKVDINVTQGIDITGALHEARERLILRPRCDSAPPIDGDFVALPGVASGRAVDCESTLLRFGDPLNLLL